MNVLPIHASAFSSKSVTNNNVIFFSDECTGSFKHTYYIVKNNNTHLSPNRLPISLQHSPAQGSGIYCIYF